MSYAGIRIVSTSQSLPGCFTVATAMSWNKAFRSQWTLLLVLATRPTLQSLTMCREICIVHLDELVSHGTNNLSRLAALAPFCFCVFLAPGSLGAKSMGLCRIAFSSHVLVRVVDTCRVLYIVPMIPLNSIPRTFNLICQP